MKPRALVQRLLVGRTPFRIYECRNCGTTVDADTDTCPDCESDDIAEYRLR